VEYHLIFIESSGPEYHIERKINNSKYLEIKKKITLTKRGCHLKMLGRFKSERVQSHLFYAASILKSSLGFTGSMPSLLVLYAFVTTFLHGLLAKIICCSKNTQVHFL
jgi:hypothetical protein